MEGVSRKNPYFLGYVGGVGFCPYISRIHTTYIRWGFLHARYLKCLVIWYTINPAYKVSNWRVQRSRQPHKKTPRGQGCKNSQETLGNSRGFFGYQDLIFTEPEIGELHKRLMERLHHRFPHLSTIKELQQHHPNLVSQAIFRFKYPS